MPIVVHSRESTLRSPLRRISSWAKLIAVTGGAQAVVQAIGFLSGILVIRLLPTQEYALYTLANTLLGTMTLLADGGISIGVMSQGGKVWQDREKLGGVLATGLHLRKKFAVCSLMIATPILFYLLRKHDASWLMSTLIMLSLIPAFVTSLSGSLLEVPFKLHQDIVPLQKIQIVANIGRLLLLALTLFIYPFAAVAILCAGGGQVWSNWRLRKVSERFVSHNQAVNFHARVEIMAIVKRAMPGAIYYCFSGQISVWLISFFGTTESLAQIGALTRLTMILNLISVVIGTLVVPRFARLPSIRTLLISHYLQVQCILFFLISIVMLIVWFFPGQVLYLIGKNYTNLTIELFFMVLAACLGLVSGIVYSLNAVRRYIFPPIFLYPLLISGQISFLMIFQIKTVLMAAYYSITMQLLAYLLHFGYGIFSLSQIKHQK